jgi:hypothetical protein
VQNEDFAKDLCETLLACDIALHKLRNPVLNRFLTKYTSKHVPSESTVRTKYVPEIYENTIQLIRDKIGESSIWVCLDETTDSLGHHVGKQ